MELRAGVFLLGIEHSKIKNVSSVTHTHLNEI